jgi:hypothetical protein
MSYTLTLTLGLLGPLKGEGNCKGSGFPFFWYLFPNVCEHHHSCQIDQVQESRIATTEAIVASSPP